MNLRPRLLLASAAALALAVVILPAAHAAVPRCIRPESSVSFVRGSIGAPTCTRPLRLRRLLFWERPPGCVSRPDRNARPTRLGSAVPGRLLGPARGSDERELSFSL